MRTDGNRSLWICLVLCIAWQTAVAETPGAGGAEVPMIELNFPEQLELKVLIDYVAKRNGINFLYESALISGKRVTLVATQKIPADSLMALLESVLASKGLVMTPDAGGMIRIETAGPVTQSSTGPVSDPIPKKGLRPGQAVTRVIRLDHARPQQVETVIKPFLLAATANVTRLDEHGIVILTDYAPNLRRVEELIELMDRPGKRAEVRFVRLEHTRADELVQKVNTVLEEQTAPAGAGQAGVNVLAYARTNQLVVIGEPADVDRGLELIRSFDVPLGLVKKVYSFEVASADRVDRLVRQLIGDLDVDRLYRSTIDRDANLLVVAATEEIHKQIESVRRAADRPVSEARSPIRFYKLENAKAADVLETLRSIEGERGLAEVTVDGIAADARNGEEEDQLPIRGPTAEQINRIGRSRGDTGAREAVELGDARVMADEPSNTIIVIARPSMHPIYEKLIRRLDVRRPQVLVEVTIVTIDTSDGFSLGVEISRREEFDDGKSTLLNFSSFGLSTVEDNARLTLSPGVGFNGTLISADVADVVIRALKSDSRARVVSRPSLLINDNATGTLSSESEQPFASINASTSVATSTLGGYVAAGTKLIMTPQISEGEHLKLEYEVSLSSFSESASEELPPPRQTNSLTSEATMPNGYTIVVGGLSREDVAESIDRVPLLGEIPGLEYLFSNRSTTKRQTTLFVFIRATILRDDKFKSLKLISAEAARQAELEDDFPKSEAVEIP